jgi:hypothetical protein
MNRRWPILFIFCCCVLCGCEEPDSVYKQPAGLHLTKTQATRIAQEEATKAGYKIGEFTIQKPHFVTYVFQPSGPTNHAWEFDFIRKKIESGDENSPQNAFAVTINDETRKVQIQISR